MKKSKLKVLAFATTLMIGITVATTETAQAFGGYAHWQISGKVMDNAGVTSGNTRRQYQSGTLMADLGKMNWDTYYTTTDGYTFSAKVRDIGVASKFGSRMFFGRGWYDHYIQDTKGAVANISGGPSSYRVKCGWIDEYLRDKRGIVTPINGKTYAYVDYDSIRGAYKALDNFSPTDAQIDTEINRMYAGYHQAILLNIQGMSSSEVTSMDNEFARVAKLCGGIKTVAKVLNNFDIYIEDSNQKDDYETFVEILNSDKTGKLKEKLDKAIKYTSVEKEKLEDGAYNVTIRVDDEEKYNKHMNELTETIKRNHMEKLK